MSTQARSVEVIVTPSLTCTVSDRLGLHWTARCPLCLDAGRTKRWKVLARTRKAAEDALKEHMDSHGQTQGSLV